MSDAETADLHARLRELEAKYAKAQRYREKWATKAADYEKKLRAFELVLEDIGLAPKTPSSNNSAEGLTAKVRDAVESLEPGVIFTVDELRSSLGDYAKSPTSPITKALVRMTEEDVPLIDLEEKGAGKRQSRYRVLDELPVQDEEEEDADGTVVRYRAKQS